MPKERHQFQGADRKWRAIMEAVQHNPLVLQVTDTDNLLKDLQARLLML